MVSNVRPKRLLASFLVASAVALYAPAPFAGQAPSASRPSLDYEFFKTRVEPIFLEKRWPDHARCYVCHEISRHGGGPLSLERLSPGTSFWTEEQSRANFQVVSKLVIPGNPLSSLLLIMPLAPEVGGIADTHQGGNLDPRTTRTGRTWRHGSAGKRREVPPRRSRKVPMHCALPLRQIEVCSGNPVPAVLSHSPARA
jgi:hypothetical protein